MIVYSATELSKFPTLRQERDRDLKVLDGDYRYWLSRPAPDGAGDPQFIIVEKLVQGQWVVKGIYQGDIPRAPRRSGISV